MREEFTFYGALLSEDRLLKEIHAIEIMQERMADKMMVPLLVEASRLLNSGENDPSSVSVLYAKLTLCSNLKSQTLDP